MPRSYPAFCAVDTPPPKADNPLGRSQESEALRESAEKYARSEYSLRSQVRKAQASGNRVTSADSGALSQTAQKILLQLQQQLDEERKAGSRLKERLFQLKRNAAQSANTLDGAVAARPF